MNDPDCFICRKHRGETATPGAPIYQDGLLYAGHAEFRPGEESAYLGYLMVEPRRHVPSLAELTDEEAQALGSLVARLSRVLKDQEGAEHVYAFVLGDRVPHLHVHLVPRYPGAPPEYRGVHVDEWPGAPRGDAAAIEALCQRLSRHLREMQSISEIDSAKETEDMNPYISVEERARLSREIHRLPTYVEEALQARKLEEAYRARPAYQKNDYIGWITRAKREETRRNRLAQMLAELEAGDTYMKMAYRGQ